MFIRARLRCNRGAGASVARMPAFCTKPSSPPNLSACSCPGSRTLVPRHQVQDCRGQVRAPLLFQATGGNQDLAAGIMSGVIDVKSDGQGGFVMINKATGQATPMGGQQDGASKFGIGTAPGAPQPGTAPAQFPNASVPGNLPYRDAFGLTGANSYLAGRAQDLFEGRMGKQTGAVNDAITRLEMINNQAIDALKENVDGVSRLKDSHRRIVEMLPKPGNLLSGPSYASKQYGALMEELDKEIGIETQNLNSPGTATIKSKSAERVRRLSAARDNVASVLQQLSGNGQQQTQGGTPQQAPAAPGIKDGATATNPSTGQRVIRRNGKWEPL